MSPHSDPKLSQYEQYCYGDYKTWPQEERWELINGTAWDMCAAPNRFHQYLVTELASIIRNFLKGKSCQVYVAPFDVFFPDSPDQEEDSVTTVVQPDITIVCQKEKLTTKGCFGAPDMTVEILSPFTQRKDLNEKFRLYEHSGVTEYWVIDPAGRSLQQYVLGNNGFYGKGLILEEEGVVESTVLEGLTLELADLFKDME